MVGKVQIQVIFPSAAERIQCIIQLVKLLQMVKNKQQLSSSSSRFHCIRHLDSQASCGFICTFLLQDKFGNKILHIHSLHVHAPHMYTHVVDNGYTHGSWPLKLFPLSSTHLIKRVFIWRKSLSNFQIITKCKMLSVKY